MTAEIYYDAIRSDEVAVAWSPAGPFHTLTSDGRVEHGFAPRRFLTLLHGDAVDELQDKLDELQDKLDDAHDEASARHDDHVEELRIEELRIEREKADEDALTKVLEAIETVLNRGEITALLVDLDGASDALRDELVFQFTEVLS